jgi:transcriptional regulator with XRE-family HTH domain
MTWNPERIAQLRKDRRETQEKFGKAVGVDRTTVSEWENGHSAVSALNAAALDALAGGPRDTSRDFERGVLYACEAMSETIARLLREQREAAESIVRQAVQEKLADLPPAPAPRRRGTSAASRRTAAPQDADTPAARSGRPKTKP